MVLRSRDRGRVGRRRHLNATRPWGLGPRGVLHSVRREGPSLRAAPSLNLIGSAWGPGARRAPRGLACPTRHSPRATAERADSVTDRQLPLAADSLCRQR
jgi:hypothetical protein